MLLSASITGVALAAMAPSTSADSTATEAKKSRLVCQVQEETGSRLRRKKVCLTPDEWLALKRETQQVTEKIQTQRATKY